MLSRGCIYLLPCYQNIASTLLQCCNKATSIYYLVVKHSISLAIILSWGCINIARICHKIASTFLWYCHNDASILQGSCQDVALTLPPCSHYTDQPYDFVTGCLKIALMCINLATMLYKPYYHLVKTMLNLAIKLSYSCINLITKLPHCCINLPAMSWCFIKVATTL